MHAPQTDLGLHRSRLHLGGHHGRLGGEAVVLQEAQDGVLLPQSPGYLLCACLHCSSIGTPDLHQQENLYLTLHDM